MVECMLDGSPNTSKAFGPLASPKRKGPLKLWCLFTIHLSTRVGFWQRQAPNRLFVDADLASSHLHAPSYAPPAPVDVFG